MRKFAVLFATLTFSVPAWAGDIDGLWEAAVETPRGEMVWTFNLAADGEKLTGSVGNDFMGDVEIQEGSIDGDEVEFKQVIERGDRKMTILYEGKVEGDELILTRTIERPQGARAKGERPGPGAGGKGGGPGGGRRGPQTITAKRVQ